MTNLETNIFKILCTATRKHPVLLRHIETITGVGGRTIRATIAKMQTDGFKIISLGVGYWVATDEECEHYVRREIKRAVSVLNKIRSMSKKIGEVVKQLELSL